VPWDEKVVWLTGASSGIGEATARELAHRGARLVLTARRLDRLEALRSLCPSPDGVRLLAADLEDGSALQGLTERALESFGRIDVLCSIAGVSQRALASDTDLAVDRRLMELNYFAPVALTKGLLPHMLSRGTGRLAVVSSVAGVVGNPMRSGYCASKHAVHGFFDALRAELHGTGVAVTLICPGYIRTDLSRMALAGDGSRYGRESPGQAHGISAEGCARRLVRAVERGRREVYIAGPKERAAVLLKRWWPGLLARALPRISSL
jgi:short-subunit dehydrogenase